MEETIKGIVNSNIFKNEDSGFGIFTINVYNSNQKPVTIKGPLHGLELESFYEFTGKFVEDPRFGLQFQVSSFERMLPKQRSFVVRYLSGPAFPGIGEKMAEKIVDAYGEEILDDLREERVLSLNLKGLSSIKAQMIVETVKKQNPEEELVSFLLSNGLTQKQIIKISKAYGDESLKLLEQNPYRLVYDVDGIGFKTADKIGQALHVAHDDPNRIEAFVLDQYKSRVFGAGDSFISEETLFQILPSDHDDLYLKGFQSLIQKGELVNDEGRIYHYTQYDSEVLISEVLRNFSYKGPDFDIDDFESKLMIIEKDLSITFDAQQKEAIEEFLNEDVMILTGGPGTGKSTLLSGLVRLMQENMPWLHITLCAPTGRAAKRLEDLTNVSATTVHSILKWDLESNAFGMHEENPIETDILIVDEFSMVDTWLLANLLKASAKVKKYLFVGDQNQLPSVSSGFVLGDLIASKRFKTIALEHNYRQAAGSEVVDLAIQMSEGFFEIDHYHKDVRFFDSRYGPVKDIVVKIFEEALNKGYKVEDIQVLAPMYKGPAGIDNLNHFLQKMVNPPRSDRNERQVGTRIYREGDKILQLKNQPDDFVFNGDIGTLIEVDSKSLTVDYDGNYVTYDNTDIINITHAYAMSVHKSQGSEYPIVILIAVDAFSVMLGRRLYYTGVTRASKSLCLVGEQYAFQRAVLNHHESKRNTYLKQRLEK